jgi:hypothetical protein
MVIQRKATGVEDFHTYKDGFGTFQNPSKMVARGVPASSFNSAGNTVQYRPSTPVGPESCLLHTLNIVNTTTDDCFLEIFDHRGTSATTARRTRLLMDDSPYLALSKIQDRGSTQVVVADDTTDFSVGDIVTVCADGVPTAGPSNVGYEECVVTANIPAAPGSITLRRGCGGTIPLNHYNNTPLHGGRLRLKMLIQGRDKTKPYRDIVLPIPILMENGWAMRSYKDDENATSALIVNCTYTKLEHFAQHDQTNLASPYVDYIGQVPNAHQRFLRTGWASGFDTSTVIHWIDNDCEIYGISAVSNTQDGYKTVYGKSYTGLSNRVYYTVQGADETDDDHTDPKGAFTPMWYPYPIYCKGGLAVSHSAAACFSTILFRPVQALNSTGSDSMMDL